MKKENDINTSNSKQVDNSIDLIDLLLLFLSKLWIIIIAAVVGGAAAFCRAKFMMPLEYSSHISMYVQSYTDMQDNGMDNYNYNDISKSKQLINTFPLMEDSPCEAIKNNAIGTYKTAYAAMMYGCKRFVLISTDKAVNPTNIMGASKRLCEMIIQTFDKVIKSGNADKLPRLFAHSIDENGSVSGFEFTEKPRTE